MNYAMAKGWVPPPAFGMPAAIAGRAGRAARTLQQVANDNGWSQTCSVGSGGTMFGQFTGCTTGQTILSNGTNTEGKITSTTSGSTRTYAFMLAPKSSNQAFLPTPTSVRVTRINENWRKAQNISLPAPSVPVADPGDPGRKALEVPNLDPYLRFFSPWWIPNFPPFPAFNPRALPALNPIAVPRLNPLSAPRLDPPPPMPLTRAYPATPWRQVGNRIGPNPIRWPAIKRFSAPGVRVTLGGRHERKPPGPRQKQRKGSPYGKGWAGLLNKGFQGLTEAGDFVNAIYGALPSHLRIPYQADGPITLQQKALAIYNNAAAINLPQAMWNVIYNQLEDGAVGGLNARASKTPRITGGLPVGYGFKLGTH